METNDDEDSIELFLYKNELNEKLIEYKYKKINDLYNHFVEWGDITHRDSTGQFKYLGGLKGLDNMIKMYSEIEEYEKCAFIEKLKMKLK